MQRIGSSMQHIGARLNARIQKARQTERGELMRHFCSHLNPDRLRESLPAITMSRMGKILEGIPTKDLYYLKSVCDRAKNFSTTFWYQLDPEKYDEKNKGKFEKKKWDGRFL